MHDDALRMPTPEPEEMPPETGSHPSHVWLVRLMNDKHQYFKEVFGLLRDAETFIRIMHKDAYSHDCEIVKTTLCFFEPTSFGYIDDSFLFHFASTCQSAQCTACAPFSISISHSLSPVIFCIVLSQGLGHHMHPPTDFTHVPINVHKHCSYQEEAAEEIRC